MGGGNFTQQLENEDLLLQIAFTKADPVLDSVEKSAAYMVFLFVGQLAIDRSSLSRTFLPTPTARSVIPFARACKKEEKATVIFLVKTALS